MSHNHPDFYYTDGNLVINCKDKAGKSTYFRIHRSYLSAHSSVIDDMLTLPPPTSSDELYEGLPVVEFAVDPDDMSNFLKFFYQPWNDGLSAEDPDIAFKLFEVVKLADMLMIDRLKESILSRIKQDWQSQSIQEWALKKEFYRRTPKCCFSEPASVLRVARQFCSALASPLLFYELSFRDPFDLYDSKNPSNMKARWDLVSAQDRVKAGMGRTNVLYKVTELLGELRPHIFCLNKKNACASRWPIRLDSIYCNIISGQDPLSALSFALLEGKRGDWINELEEYIPEIFCNDCARNWDFRIIAIQKAMFGDLHNFYTDLV